MRPILSFASAAELVAVEYNHPESAERATLLGSGQPTAPPARWLFPDGMYYQAKVGAVYP